MTHTPHAVIFDVANVIVQWDPMLPLSGRVSHEAAAAFLEHSGFWELNAEADAGLSTTAMLARVDADLPELSDTFRVYLEHFADSVPGVVPGTAEVIDELLAHGVPVFGLSNWWQENFAVPRRVAPVIGRLRDVVVSGEAGVAKPAPEIFSLAAQQFGVDPASTLFVDDALVNIESADALGFATHHFTDAKRLRHDLTQRGLLPA